MIKEFANALSEKIKLGLPGFEAHKIMAPISRPIKNYEEKDYPNAKKSSVLILFYPFNEEIHLVFIKRPSYDGVHSGQVSFPGGKAEELDTSRQHTALRETEEEIGVAQSEITVFGKLSDIYIPPSNFFVFPYLGYASSRPNFKLDPTEVEYLIEAPIKLLADPKIKSTLKMQRGGEPINVPCYLINKHRVWGATAILLSELEFLLRDITLD